MSSSACAPSCNGDGDSSDDMSIEADSDDWDIKSASACAPVFGGDGESSDDMDIEADPDD